MQKRPNLGSLIKDYRLKLGFTQTELAEKLGYNNPQFISLVERDQSKAPLSMIGQLVVVLGIPENEIQELIVENFRDFVHEQISVGIKEAKQKFAK